jgi:hypothetical protein
MAVVTTPETRAPASAAAYVTTGTAAPAAYTGRLTGAQIFSFADLVRRLNQGPRRAAWRT